MIKSHPYDYFAFEIIKMTYPWLSLLTVNRLSSSELQESHVDAGPSWLAALIRWWRYMIYQVHTVEAWNYKSPQQQILHRAGLGIQLQPSEPLRLDTGAGEFPSCGF